MGIESTKEKLASTGQTFRFGPETILKLATAATLVVLAAVVIFVVIGAVRSVLLVDLDLDLILTAVVNSLVIAAGAVVSPYRRPSFCFIYNRIGTFQTGEDVLDYHKGVIRSSFGGYWLSGWFGSVTMSLLKEHPTKAISSCFPSSGAMVYPSLASFLIDISGEFRHLKTSSYALGAALADYRHTVYPAADPVLLLRIFGLGRTMGILLSSDALASSCQKQQQQIRTTGCLPCRRRL